MAHKVTERIRNRAQELAYQLRIIGSRLDHSNFSPSDCEALEIAAILLEQTSASRVKQAIHAFNQAHDRYVRRQKVGQ